MNTHSSGYYSIDKDYNILSYNDTAKQLYPNLQPGVKCYKALMGLDSPCPPCPVALGIQGPKTYLDPQCYRAGWAWGIKPHKCLIAFHSRLEIGVQLFGSVVIA